MKKAINDAIRTIKQLLYILTSAQKRESIVVFIAMICGSCLELLGVSAMYPFLQAIVDVDILSDKWYVRWIYTFFPNARDKQIIVFLGVCIMIVFLLKNAGVLLSNYIQIRFSAKFYRELSTHMLDSYMRRPYEFFVNTNSSTIMRGISGDVSSVYQIILCGFQMLAEMINIVLIGGYLIITDAVIAGLSIAVAGVCFVVITLGFKGIMKKSGKRMREAQTWQNRYCYQAITGIKEITVLGRRQAFVKKYEVASKNVEKYTVASGVSSAAPDRIIEGVCMAGIMIVLCIRLVMGIDMGNLVPVLGVFAMGAFKLLPSVSKISSRINQIVFCMPGFDSTYANLKEAERFVDSCDIPTETNKDAGISHEVVFNKEIQVKGISWRYSGGSEDILENLSLTIKKGDSVGLIGSSGAGKSTLSDILMGLFEPQKGTVEVDGESIYKHKDQWAQKVGYVPQNIFLVDDTVRANVAFGLPKEEISDEKVWNALERAQIKDFIMKLPDGLDTMVGEFGVKFSGGQRQRIAIARALYNEPEVLILDEATSALDNETEKALMEAIDLLQGTITMVIVAHRLTTIKNCDHIYEIRKGTAIERRREELGI